MKTHSEARVIGSSSRPRVVGSAALVGLGVAFASGPAYAHVKWFAPYDVVASPLAVGEVLTPQFVRFFLGSILLVYGYFWFDRLILRQHVLETVLARLKVSEATAGAIMRGAAFIFFGAAGVYGLTTEAFLLTPELKAADPWVPWLQLAMAACALHRRALPVIGLGIAVLYFVAVGRYGIFHLLDYLILAGVAYYFMAAAANGPGWTKSRYITLYATTGLTLLWASVEKWGYAAWTLPLLESKPNLLMGLDPGTYMILAGFVEFNVTFLLLSSVSLVSRIVALGLLGIFVLATYEFGLIDAIGHLLIMAILFVLVVHGPTTGRNFLAMPEKSLWVEAYFMTGLYALAFVLIFIAYYGIHALAYGN
jgi:hypothetical protein